MPMSSRARAGSGTPTSTTASGTSSGTTTACPTPASSGCGSRTATRCPTAWAPARIPVIGPPAPVHGRARADGGRSAGGPCAPARVSRRGPPRRAPVDAPPAPLPAYSASVHRIGPALRDDDALDPWSRVPGAVVRPQVAAAVVRRLRRRGAPRRDRRRRGPRARTWSGCSPGCTTPAGRSGGCGPRATSEVTTSARWRPTTPRDSTADASRGATTGPPTPTAPRSTSTRSRTRTCTTGPCVRRRGVPPRGWPGRAGASLPPGTIRAGDLVVEAFAEIGWEWGGSWSSPDYQHFSAGHEQ